MRVSVAVATYNGAPYLGEQLESLARQTLAPFELIVCDDGSSDVTLEIIRTFSRSASFPVRIFQNEQRLNFRKNFMQAAGHCTGDLIAFCDQDDIWRSDKLALVASAFEMDEDVLLVHHNARIFSTTSAVTGAHGAAAPHTVRRVRGVTGSLFDPRKLSSVEPPLSRTPFDLPPGFTQTFRRSLLMLSPLRDATLDYWAAGEALAHDQWIYILASSLGKVSYIAHQLVDYRQHEANLYGMKVEKHSIFRKLVGRLTGYRDYGHLSLAFSSISRALAAASAYPLGDLRAGRAAEASRCYALLSQAYGYRSRAYCAAAPRERAGAWLRLCSEGRYRSGSRFFFSNGAIVYDFIHGVCRGRLRHPHVGLSANDPSLRLVPKSRMDRSHAI